MDRIADHITTLPVDQPIWERFYTVAPLVLIGTREVNGRDNLAPKHLVTPMGWDNYFGFVCAPNHRTYQNIKRTRCFTVSYPRASQVTLASLAAEPRGMDDSKPNLPAIPTFPATLVQGCFIEDAYLFLECRLDRFIDGFGPNSLITGKIVAAHVDERAMRASDREDAETAAASCMLAYLSPGRFSPIRESFGFPFPAGYRR